MAVIEKREAWNKGKPIGQKPPLKPKNIWAIRIHPQERACGPRFDHVQLGDRCKLHGCDLVSQVLLLRCPRRKMFRVRAGECIGVHARWWSLYPPTFSRGWRMQFVCDGPNGTWFRMETEGEASKESQLMNHAVEKHFRRAAEEAEKTFVPPTSKWAFEQKIRLKSHVQKVMPIFVTLRDREGAGLATAMLSPAGEDETSFRPIVVGPANADPYPKHGEDIKVLARHYGLTLDPARCYPYRRG